MIRQSEAHERSMRRAACDDEFGGTNSVRSRSGGLPGQGRARRGHLTTPGRLREDFFMN
jgi:hypothetical protein